MSRVNMVPAIGVIKEKEGLVSPEDRTKTKLKEESNGHYYLEYGCFEMHYRSFKCFLQRNLFNTSGRRAELEIRQAIIRHAYGSDSEEILSLSWWTAGDKKEVTKVSTAISEKRRKTLDSRLEDLLKTKIIDENETHILKGWLFHTVASDYEEKPSPQRPCYSILPISDGRLRLFLI